MISLYSINQLNFFLNFSSHIPNVVIEMIALIRNKAKTIYYWSDTQYSILCFGEVMMSQL